jgi:hypothetical protein
MGSRYVHPGIVVVYGRTWCRHSLQRGVIQQVLENDTPSRTLNS